MLRYRVHMQLCHVVQNKSDEDMENTTLAKCLETCLKHEPTMLRQTRFSLRVLSPETSLNDKHPTERKIPACPFKYKASSLCVMHKTL